MLDTPQTVRMIVNLADQYKVLLQERGFLRNAEDVAAANTFSRSWEVVKAVLCAGLYPNAIRVDSGRKRVKLFTKVCTAPGVVRAVFATVMVGNVRMSRPQGHGKITPHPSSVNGHEQHFDHRWLMYHDKVRTVGGLFVYDSSTMPPLPMLLFGGGDTAGELFIREAKYVLVTLSAWCHGGCAIGPARLIAPTPPQVCERGVGGCGRLDLLPHASRCCACDSSSSPRGAICVGRICAQPRRAAVTRMQSPGCSRVPGGRSWKHGCTGRNGRWLWRCRAPYLAWERGNGNAWDGRAE